VKVHKAALVPALMNMLQAIPPFKVKNSKPRTQARTLSV
jgi:hypothetical protein